MHCAPRAVRESVAHQGRPVALCNPSMSFTAPCVVGHSLAVASSSKDAMCQQYYVSVVIATEKLQLAISADQQIAPPQLLPLFHVRLMKVVVS